MIKRIFSAFAAVVMLAACHHDNPGNGGNEKPIINPNEVYGATAVIDPATTYQTWDGFGAMNLGGDWNEAIDWSNKETDTLMGEMGLSIMRIRIPYDESKWALLPEKVKYAVDTYGARVLATPWTMPATMKAPQVIKGKDENGNVTVLKENSYADYAAYLQRFINYMAREGAPIYAISIQNEPDWAPENEGCSWTAMEHLKFVKEQGQNITGALLVSGESIKTDHSFYDPVLNDAAACDNIDIIGGHLYGTGTEPKPYPLAAQKGKALWMTEHQLSDSWRDNSSTWFESLDMAKEIHACLVNGWNAYIWWYGIRYYSFLGDGEANTVRGAVLPRGRIYAQFSKYIRPGDVRIGISLDKAGYLLATAFKAADGRVSIVVVNPGPDIYKDFEIEVGNGFTTISGSFTDSNLPANLTPELRDGKIIVDIKATSVTSLEIR